MTVVVLLFVVVVVVVLGVVLGIRGVMSSSIGFGECGCKYNCGCGCSCGCGCRCDCGSGCRPGFERCELLRGGGSFGWIEEVSRHHHAGLVNADVVVLIIGHVVVVVVVGIAISLAEGVGEWCRGGLGGERARSLFLTGLLQRVSVWCFCIHPFFFFLVDYGRDGI